MPVQLDLLQLLSLRKDVKTPRSPSRIRIAMFGEMRAVQKEQYDHNIQYDHEIQYVLIKFELFVVSTRSPLLHTWARATWARLGRQGITAYSKSDTASVSIRVC